jgi:fumarate hydratase subunit beta
MPVERLNDLEVRLTTPLTDEDVAQLKIGDHVRVSGVIYTARDAAHNRMVASLNAGEQLPIDIKGQLIYYVGPTPSRPGRSSGSFGPTTSMRMDPFTPRLLEEGLKACMGKGNRGPEVQEALKKYRAVYLMAVGGAGAMLSQFVKKIEVVAYEDLGTESLKRVEVEDFPASKLGSYQPSERIIVAQG